MPQQPISRPFAGAWIETPSSQDPLAQILVAPLRGRGLKRQALMLLRRRYDVAPLRGRGLKHVVDLTKGAGY